MKLPIFSANKPPWVADPRVKTWALTPCKADLTACNTAGELTWPRVNGKFLLGSYRVPPGQHLIIKTIVPYAQARVQVGLVDTEYFQMIDPDNAVDQFGFEPVVSGGPSNTQFSSSMPGMDIYAATDNEPWVDVKTERGIFGISASPYDTAVRAFDSDAFNIVVSGGNTFSLLFSLVQEARGPVAAAVGPPVVHPLTDPIPGRYSIGGREENTRRIDYAGAYVWGFQVDTSLYEDTVATLTGSKK